MKIVFDNEDFDGQFLRALTFNPLPTPQELDRF